MSKFILHKFGSGVVTGISVILTMCLSDLQSPLWRHRSRTNKFLHQCLGRFILDMQLNVEAGFHIKFIVLGKIVGDFLYPVVLLISNVFKRHGVLLLPKKAS